jgi:Arf-GAP/SH3 domain/ANK repeat/PH domain-containing protein
MQGNQIYGFRKSGYLLKKSEGKMRVKAWRKRRCEISDGYLFIYHSDETQPPTKLNLLTCQVKLVPGKEKKCFDLISYNRTYHFQVEDEHDITAWVYVLINCKEGALKKQFDDPNSNSKDFVDFGDANNTTTNSTTDNNSPSKRQNSTDESLHRFRAEQQLQQQLIRQVQALSGNDRCVDCSTNKDKPTWLSTNLGVLVCIECSGIHRDLGVHLSRIQSLTLDNINTSQLLIAHNMGNDFFNEIFEAKLRQLELLAADIASPNISFDTPRLKPNSSMEQRCEFIRAKYLHRKFCQTNHHLDENERIECLKQAVISKDLRKLLQLFGEGFDIASCISIDQDTSIHLALSCQASRENTGVQFECDLFILDFIIQNSRSLNKQNARGETPLHYCAKYNLPECMKLLLRSGADVNIRNNNGETPLDVVKNLKQTDYNLLIEILGDA